jgi:hypothetical protein
MNLDEIIMEEFPDYVHALEGYVVSPRFAPI